ncbi:unnamed protein product, partial [Ectocarpus sp. 6 AP-2014]
AALNGWKSVYFYVFNGCGRAPGLFTIFPRSLSTETCDCLCLNGKLSGFCCVVVRVLLRFRWVRVFGHAQRLRDEKRTTVDCVINPPRFGTFAFLCGIAAFPMLSCGVCGGHTNIQP